MGRGRFLGLAQGGEMGDAHEGPVGSLHPDEHAVEDLAHGGGEADTPGAAGELAQLRRIGRDCLEGIGALENPVVARSHRAAGA